jgi:ArsR family transcriptional regulator, arsenate/arsenite/antimonite-responsive transcriptional repressor
MDSSLTTARDLKVHFVGLANPTRMAIVSLLVSGERTASEIARRLKLSQPLLSWHLRVMRRGGLIGTRRSGREVLCSLDRKSIREFQERFNQLIREPEGETSGPALTVAPAVGDKEIANAI